ncbi:unnamed protein product, partial [Cyprideis torosa]
MTGPVPQRTMEHALSNQIDDVKKRVKDSHAKLKNTVNELPNFIRDYMAFHKASCNKPVAENKYMIFTEKHNLEGGGIGDRLRGLVFTFFWAIATNRTFLIYWDNPFNLTEVFQPATDLDWNCNAEEAFNRSTFFYMNGFKKNSKYTKKWSSDENWPAFTAVQTNYYAMYVPKKYPQPMKELFQREKASLHSLSLFEIAFNALLKPSKALTHRLMEIRSAIGLKDPQQPYITMHFRMGKAGNVSWNDPARNSPEDIPKILKCGRKLQRDYSEKFGIAQEQLPLVFLTDSQATKQFVAAQNPDIRTVDSEIIHIDRYVNNREAAPKQGYIDAWAEFLLIRESRCIVKSVSGFSIVASMMGRYTEDDQIVPAISRGISRLGIQSEYFNPLMVSCPLSPQFQGLPLGVTLLSRPHCHDQSIRTIPVHRAIPRELNAPSANSTYPFKFVVCVKGIDYIEDRTFRLVEWIEGQKLMGANHIDTYVFELLPNNSRILDHYVREGFLTKKLYTWPSSLPRTHEERKIQQFKRVTQTIHLEKIPYHDCLLRNHEKYDFILPIDLDEIIVPKQHDSWQAYFSDKLRELGPEKFWK